MTGGNETEIKLAHRNCPLCGADDAEFIRSRGPVNIVLCKDCGLVYQNPYLADEKVQYKAPEDESVYEKYFEQFMIARRPALNRMFDISDKYRKPPGVFFDIGCGFGQIMAVARERGWKTRGLDLTPSAVEFCRKRGEDVFLGFFGDCGIVDGSIDAACLHNVIEVLPDPVGELQKIHSALSTGGVLVIKGLNAPFHIGAHRLHKAGGAFFKAAGIGDPSMFHLATYSRKPLERLADMTGFEMVEFTQAAMSRNDPNDFLKKTGMSKKALLGAFKAYEAFSSVYGIATGGRGVVSPSYIAVMLKSG